MSAIIGFSERGLALLLTLLLVSVVCHAKPPLPVTLHATMPPDPFAHDGLSFRALCYHDARDRLRDTLRDWPEATAVDTYDLIQHFSWLKENGYHVVSLEAIVAARSGGPALPPKAVLLTFDDGYRSVYTRVFPLLKLFGYPALIALVGEWLEENTAGKVWYGDRWLPREQFVTWAQVREMLASGLVEVASHSHSLHKGLMANAQGGQPPAAITRSYDAATRSYESDAAYYARLYNDLAHNAAVLERHTGSKPRVMVWPYGAYIMPGVEAAQAAGMPITMNLEPGPNTPTQPLSRIRRRLVYFHYGIGDFKQALHEPAELDGEEKPRQRMVHVNLDTVYDADPAQQEHNVGQLIERISRFQVNTVYLQAFADLDGNGAADALYFPNRHLPIRTDVFNRVAWQLRARASVHVYAWLPVLAFDLPAHHPSAGLTVAATANPPESAQKTATPRPSPCAADARQTIQDIYEDLAKNAPVAGLVFHDAAACNDFRAYRERFALELAARFRLYQPAILTVRTLEALPVLDPAAAARLVPSVVNFLKDYDFVAVLAMPAVTPTSHPERWLGQFVDTIASLSDALYRTVFILPSVDEGAQRSIRSTHLAAQLQVLQRHGARNFGYASDDFQHNHPAFEVMKPVISLATNPGRQP